VGEKKWGERTKRSTGEPIAWLRHYQGEVVVRGHRDNRSSGRRSIKPHQPWKEDAMKIKTHVKAGASITPGPVIKIKPQG
jgi:hypothetical protein